jgi:hypothetical protein
MAGIVVCYLTETMQHALNTAWASAEFELGLFLPSEFANHGDVALHARHEHRESDDGVCCEALVLQLGSLAQRLIT